MGWKVERRPIATYGVHAHGASATTTPESVSGDVVTSDDSRFGDDANIVGDLTAGTVASSGAITGATVTLIGALAAGSLASSAAVTGTSLTLTGAAAAGSMASSGTINAAGALTAGSIASSGAFKLPTEALTGTDAVQNISADGISFLTYGTSGISNDFNLSAPTSGALKLIFAVNNTTSVELNINAEATAAAKNFWGTTYNTVTLSAASTGSPGGTPAGAPMLMLVGVSTAQWAIVPGSSFNWDFSNTTGSTGLADP